MKSAELTTLIEPAVVALGLEIDRIEIVNAGKRALVRIFLDGDGPSGTGPSLDQITDATRQVSNLLDGADLTRGRAYTLEVSSRGLSRPLTEPKHFRRNLGRLVEFQLEQEKLIARLVAAQEQQLTVEDEAGSRELQLAQVRRAVVQIEMNRPTVEDEDEESEA